MCYGKYRAISFLSLYSFECPEQSNVNYLDCIERLGPLFLNVISLHLNIVFCNYESDNAKRKWHQQNLVPCLSNLAY